MWRRGGAKYNNLKCTCNLGHKHDSRGEAQYCNELQIMTRAGHIKSFQIQVMYDLCVNGKKICGHRVDFVVETNDGSIEVREFKGFATNEWAIKHKLFEALFPEIPYKVIRPRG